MCLAEIDRLPAVELGSVQIGHLTIDYERLADGSIDALDARVTRPWEGCQAFRNTDAGALLLQGMSTVLDASGVSWEEFLEDYVE